MTAEYLGWDGAGGGQFDPPAPELEEQDVPWCDRCGRAVAEHETCVGCGEDVQ